MMTCKLVGLAPACCTIASVIALHSARFCPGVRPVYICTVTTGMSCLLCQDFLDPRADAAPLTGAHRHGRPAAEPASPDRRQCKPLGSIEINAARRGRKID